MKLDRGREADKSHEHHLLAMSSLTRMFLILDLESVRDTFYPQISTGAIISW